MFGRRWAAALTAVALTFSITVPALADGGSSGDRGAIRGTITAAGSGSITVGTTVYPLATSVTVRYHDYTLTVAQIPTNVGARVFLDASGNVDRVVLAEDPNLPRGESYRGTVQAVSQGTIQVGSYTLNLAADVTVRYHDRHLQMSSVVQGLEVRVGLDRQGNVKKIQILQDAAIPSGESARGTISAISPTSITIGTYTLAVSPDVTVRFHDHVLTVADVPTGVEAKVKVDSSLQVTRILLLQDPNLPSGESARGQITAVTSSSITIGHYTLALDPSARVKYHDYRLTVSAIPTGVEGQVHLDNHSGMVTEVKLFSDPNLPASDHVRATVTAVGSGTITLAGYTLAVDPAAQITFQGQTYQLAQIQAGWTVQVHLDSQGTVTRIEIKSGPAASQSSGG